MKELGGEIHYGYVFSGWDDFNGISHHIHTSIYENRHNLHSNGTARQLFRYRIKKFTLKMSHNLLNWQGIKSNGFAHLSLSFHSSLFSRYRSLPLSLSVSSRALRLLFYAFAQLGKNSCIWIWRCEFDTISMEIRGVCACKRLYNEPNGFSNHYNWTWAHSFRIEWTNQFIFLPWFLLSLFVTHFEMNCQMFLM